MKTFTIICTIAITVFSTISCKKDLFQYKLIAYYPFSGNANDNSKNLHHGVVNGATLTTDRKGNANSAYSFNGTSAYIDITNFGTIPDNEISVSLWAKTNAMTSNFALLLIPDNGPRFGISINYNHNNINSIFWDYGWLHQGGNSPGRLYTFEEPFDSQWHHYVVISSSAKKIMGIYKDGKLLCSKQQALKMPVSNQQIRIGSGNNANYFNGSLDEIRIYNRLLSQNEIVALSKQ